MKKLFSFGGFLVAVGILLMCAAIYLVDFDLRNFSTVSEYEIKEYAAGAYADVIAITDENVSCAVKRSYDDKIHFICFENDTETYEMEKYRTDEGFTVSLTKKQLKKWYDNIFTTNMYTQKLTVLVPSDLYPTVRMNCKNMDISMADVPCKSVEVSGVDSNITLDTMICDGDITINNINGELMLESVTAADITAKTTGGKLVANNVMSGGWAVFKTSDAAMHIFNVGALRSLTVKNANGNINGILSGARTDYDLTVNATRSNLPERSAYGNIPLYIEAMGGKVNISFAG